VVRADGHERHRQWNEHGQHATGHVGSDAVRADGRQPAAHHAPHGGQRREFDLLGGPIGAGHIVEAKAYACHRQHRQRGVQMFAAALVSECRADAGCAQHQPQLGQGDAPVVSDPGTERRREHQEQQPELSGG